ncbi:MAG: hypothetical protein H6995_14510 [Pseudomonadales bacterium]|nr:hypothetical protein [Pseudomonadales bacterium]MCP5216210.1 hypothetical protein [Pseudomonadales bacterium]
MMFRIAAKDGAFNIAEEAADLDAALEQMAARFEFTSYRAMCSDLKLTGSDLEVAILEDKRTGAVEWAEDYLKLEHERGVIASLKAWMRRI